MLLNTVLNCAGGVIVHRAHIEPELQVEECSPHLDLCILPLICPLPPRSLRMDEFNTKAPENKGIFPLALSPTLCDLPFSLPPSRGNCLRGGLYWLSLRCANRSVSQMLTGHTDTLL